MNENITNENDFIRELQLARVALRDVEMREALPAAIHHALRVVDSAIGARPAGSGTAVVLPAPTPMSRMSESQIHREQCATTRTSAGVRLVIRE